MFIEPYLQDLRRDRFAPAAVLLYLRRVAGQVREEIDANPGAVRSVWSVALLFFALAFLASAALALRGERPLAVELLVGTSIAIGIAFGLVTLHLGLLRDPAGYRLSALNIPTALTLLRVALIPAIVLFLAERRFALALTAYVLAALSDVADGWIARRLRQVTRLGTVLDPIVDIVFNLSMIAGLRSAGLLPGWVFAVAAVRYVGLLAGGAYLYVAVGPVRIRPTPFGRLTGVFIASFVALLTLLHTVRGALAERLVTLTEIALGVLLAATIAHGLGLGWHNLRLRTRVPRAQGRVVGDVRWGPE